MTLRVRVASLTTGTGYGGTGVLGYRGTGYRIQSTWGTRGWGGSERSLPASGLDPKAPIRQHGVSNRITGPKIELLREQIGASLHLLTPKTF